MSTNLTGVTRRYVSSRRQSPQQSLNLDVRRGDAGVVLFVAGELDAHSSPQLRTTLLELVAGDDHEVVVDLAGVSFCDSTGLGVLVGAHRRMAASDRTLAVQSPRPSVRHLLEVSGLDRVLLVR